MPNAPRFFILSAMRRLLFGLAFVLACEPGGGGGPTRDGGGMDAEVDIRDSDGDGISDDEEGAAGRVDTDGDGVPDFQDDDSDGDGIPDGAEAGDDSLSTPARDSDGDGIPDFRDEDSDNNGIPDADESTMDTDGDGLPDFADQDDDNDRATDAVELMAGGPGVDTDGDGVVDFKDSDSDDDTILDGDEREIDTDMDGLLDWADLDSDSDGYSDAEEAGDALLDTPPVDTDDDGIPDFRDPDSDNDGVSDVDERAAGTDRLLEDTDMDGVSDLIEIGAGTDPLDMGDSPRTRGDFVFVVPFEEDPEPLRDTLEFRTNIQFADVYFLFDKSGSMQGEIDGMRDAVQMTLNELTCEDFGVACMTDEDCAVGVCSLATGTCSEDPSMSTCVPSIFSGAGQYHDPYNNLRSLQADPALTRTAIAGITAESSISREDFFEAVTCVANGSCGTGCTGAVGCPTYREAAVKLLVVFSDEDSDSGSLAAASSAMMTSGITFIGVWSGSTSSSARNDMVNLATNTGSFRADGTTPLVFNGMDASVSGAVTNAINEVVEGVPLRVTIEATDEPEDDGDALPFIDYLEVNVSGMGSCTMVSPTEDTNADGFDDAFPALTPGTSVCWDVVPITNDIVEPTLSPLVYKARLTVYGDGSPLDERLVFFLVPPRIEIPIEPG